MISDVRAADPILARFRLRFKIIFNFGVRIVLVQAERSLFIGVRSSDRYCEGVRCHLKHDQVQHLESWGDVGYWNDGEASRTDGHGLK